MKEFCLSDKIWITEMPKAKMILIEDIQEFIILLKEELCSFTNNNIPCNECSDCMKINKLAGDKLK